MTHPRNPSARVTRRAGWQCRNNRQRPECGCRVSGAFVNGKLMDSSNILRRKNRRFSHVADKQRKIVGDSIAFADRYSPDLCAPDAGDPCSGAGKWISFDPCVSGRHAGGAAAQHRHGGGAADDRRAALRPWRRVRIPDRARLGTQACGCDLYVRQQYHCVPGIPYG